MSKLHVTADGINIGIWCRTQLGSDRANILLDEQKQNLSAVNFPFNYKGFGWGDRYVELLDYIKENGRTPQLTKKFTVKGSINLWLKTQMSQLWGAKSKISRRKNSIQKNNQKCKLLLEAGVKAPLTNEQHFNDGFECLKRWQKKNGKKKPINTLIHNGYPLGSWVKTLRKTKQLAWLKEKHEDRYNKVKDNAAFIDAVRKLENPGEL